MRKPVAVEAYTATHQIRGNVHPGTTGLFSHMNLPTESSLEVEEAEISLLYQIGQAQEASSRLWLVKNEIVAVLVHSLGELGPSSAVRSGYTKPFPHMVRVVVGGYELRGLVHGGGRFDFRAMMFEGESRFLPLFDAHLTALLFPKVSSEAPAMLFNRSMVTTVSQIGREPGAESRSTP
ncbi:MAG: hypothetical protein MUO23_11245 [Anaerolineales bacterium]|nr:hypothetical protein [Anaerolineales bacterium]